MTQREQNLGSPDVLFVQIATRALLTIPVLIQDLFACATNYGLMRLKLDRIVL